jgi:hypothetical protein
MLKAFLLIVVGLAGDPEHGKTFHKWGTTMAEASERLGVPKERLVYLVDQPIEGDKGVSGRATRDEIGKALDGFAKQAGPEDVVFIMLIGHGSFDGRESKFNLPGPDMAAADFNLVLKRLPTKQIVLVNATSASGPFIDGLSAPGRTIVTATRSGAEHFTTLFGGFFRSRGCGQEQAGQCARGLQVRQDGSRARLRARGSARHRARAARR